MRDPRYARTRENMQEFRTSVKAGKLLRDAIRPLLMSAKDTRVTPRLVQTLFSIAKEDGTNPRGMRSPAKGLASAEGKMLLKSFSFNNAAPLTSILNKTYELDTATGTITIVDLVPLNDLVIPGGATHVSFNGAMLKIDFDSRIYDCKMTNVQNMTINSTPSSINLLPPNLPSGNGVILYFLKIEFFQEINAIQYPLMNGDYNSLAVIEVV